MHHSVIYLVTLSWSIYNSWQGSNIQYRERASPSHRGSSLNSCASRLVTTWRKASANPSKLMGIKMWRLTACWWTQQKWKPKHTFSHSPSRVDPLNFSFCHQIFTPSRIVGLHYATNSSTPPSDSPFVCKRDLVKVHSHMISVVTEAHPEKKSRWITDV